MIVIIMAMVIEVRVIDKEVGIGREGIREEIVVGKVAGKGEAEIRIMIVDRIGEECIMYTGRIDTATDKIIIEIL